MTLVSTARAPARTAFHSLTVAAVERLCDDACAITFDVPVELRATFRFRAGQSLTLRRTAGGREERRTYSISSPEGSRPRIGVRQVADGFMSTWLVRDVRPGDRIDVQPPGGNFTPDVGSSGRHVFIAAGSGITPVLSILATVLRDPGTHATLLYGNRRSDSIMFLEDLADLKDTCPARLEVVHVLSREAQEVEVCNGRLDAAKLTELIPALCDTAAVDAWWLCGPYGMVTEATAVLEDLGVPASQLHRELFYVEDLPPEPREHRDVARSSPGSEVTVILDGRATTTPVPWDGAVLDAAQRLRPDLPFACKGGVCGTCRARVTRGEVRMRRNFALEAAEIEAGYVLTCQAVPISDEVTVDYDA